jgi:hypothetical protein
MRTLIAILALFSGPIYAAMAQCTVPIASIDTANPPKVVYVDQNINALKNCQNVSNDTLSNLLTAIGGSTANVGLSSVGDIKANIDRDSNTTGAIFWVANHTADSLFRVKDDTTARFFRHLLVDSNLTVGKRTYLGDTVIMQAAIATIRAATSDGADSHRISVNGGGGMDCDPTRGACLVVRGNENGTAGQARLQAGNVLGGTVVLATGNNSPGLTINEDQSATFSSKVTAADTIAGVNGIRLGNTAGSSPRLYRSGPNMATIPESLEVQGSLRGRAYVTTLTSNTTLTTSHSVVYCNSAGGTFTVTLPTAVGALGQIYTILKRGGDTNLVVITTTSGQVIGPYSGYGLSGGYGGRLKVMSDNANWVILEAKDIGTSTACTITGVTSPTTCFYDWTATESEVIINLQNILGTSNANTLTFTSLTALARPLEDQSVRVPARDAGTYVGALAKVSSSTGVITFSIETVSGTQVLFNSSGWTGSGSKGIGASFGDRITLVLHKL